MTDNSSAVYPSLKDRVVFVTGGGSGIGASVVEEFCRQGAKVSFVDINAEASENLVRRLADAGLAVPRFIECDLKDIEKLQACIRQVIDTDGPIRTLVNNAAHDERHAIDDVTSAYFDDRVAVNLKHQFFAIQAVHQAMGDAGGGTIVNMGSVSWMIGQGGMPIYLACKSAINSILPGWIMTERQVEKWLTPEGEAELMQRQCLKRKLQPVEIAKMVLFFSADDSGICTNQNFVADGGWV